ncbi:glutaredoxin-like protein NrdH [Frondihabitans sp. 4ASC-45]|uniref:glutaredoxin-like protein NrdH n=1 Tax=Frondihabitans sp. 4ASC-45 TaxID=3111636 RepID=UPI003C23982E
MSTTKDNRGGWVVITVYSKPNCMQCKMSYRALDAKGLTYQVIDVTESDAALEYVKELGYLTAPVVVVSEHDHWGGFRPDQINRVAAGGAGEDETVGA